MSPTFFSLSYYPSYSKQEQHCQALHVLGWPQGHNGAVSCMIQLDDQQLVASGSADSTVLIYYYYYYYFIKKKAEKYETNIFFI